MVDCNSCFDNSSGSMFLVLLYSSDSNGAELVIGGIAGSVRRGGSIVGLALFEKRESHSRWTVTQPSRCQESSARMGYWILDGLVEPRNDTWKMQVAKAKMGSAVEGRTEGGRENEVRSSGAWRHPSQCGRTVTTIDTCEQQHPTRQALYLSSQVHVKYLCSSHSAAREPSSHFRLWPLAPILMNQWGHGAVAKTIHALDLG